MIMFRDYYTLAWEVQSEFPIREYRLLYRRILKVYIKQDIVFWKINQFIHTRIETSNKYKQMFFNKYFLMFQIDR